MVLKFEVSTQHLMVSITLCVFSACENRYRTSTGNGPICWALYQDTKERLVQQVRWSNVIGVMHLEQLEVLFHGPDLHPNMIGHVSASNRLPAKSA